MREKLLATLLLATVCLFAVPLDTQAQQKSAIKIELKKASLADALKKLQKTSGYQILFTYDDVKPFTVDGPIKANNINDALALIFKDKPFAWTIDGKYVSVLLVEKVEKKQPVNRQKTYKVKGHVMDSGMGALQGQLHRFLNHVYEGKPYGGGQPKPHKQPEKPRPYFPDCREP